MDAREAYLRELVELVADRLGERLLAVALIGGAGAGEFEPASSDIDVAVVVDRPEAAEAAVDLASELSHRSRPVPARRLELVVYARAGLAGGEFLLNLNTGTDVESAETQPRPGESFWFVLDLAIARGRSRALLGPPLSELVPEQPRARLAAAALEALDWFAKAEPGAPDTVLNACRSWDWAVTEEWSTKAEAARWARGRAPDPGLVEEALRLRAEGAREGLDAARVRELCACARKALVTRI